MSAPLVEGIAIVGLACRFPGARNAEEFWRNLRQGVESVHSFSDEELEAAGVDAGLLRRSDYVKARAVLADIEWFDAAFFGFNPRVAAITDPQQRIFLECAWEAIEHAGYDTPTYPGSIGIFAGVGLSSYLLANYTANQDALGAVGALQTLIGNRTDHLTTSVAYRLNLKGPAVTVQTTCSTSLVAVHLAAQSLLNYQCDMALAGAAAIEVPQNTGYLYSEGGIASPDGHCRPFDARAQGIVSGSGAGVVVLKRLSEALEEGDVIHAVIRGSAINNDGSDKVGYTAPSIDGQAQVIAMAQAIAGVQPAEVSYIEAHGTATPMGDPIEVAALKKVFGDRGDGRASCGIGSVKSNFGHLDNAAGIAGLIKTVLALDHQELPPSLNFETPNPALELEQSPFYVNTKLSPWLSRGAARIAGVSSFGIGGTNAHLIVEEAPQQEPSGPSRPWQLLLLSARTSTALESATENLRRHLEQHPDTELADVAFTLQRGRRPFAYRRAVVCRDGEDAVAHLGSLDPRRVYTSLREPRARAVFFLFPGQGAQHVNMGRALYEAEAVYRQQVDECCELLAPHLDLDLRRVLYPDASMDLEAAEARLQETFLTQPALFVTEYALARLWMSWGIEPKAMIGHSIGEYVAACLAGVFSREEALGLVAARGRLIQELPAGAMLAVHLPEEDVRGVLGRDLDVAAINRPSLCVVAGASQAVSRLQEKLAGEGVVCRPLRTSHAFHSRMMEPMLEAFIERMRKVELRPPTIPYVSNVTGTWITAAEATDAGYWARHVRQAVRLSAGIETLLQDADGLSLEVGPGTTLRTLVRQHPARPAGHQVFSSLRHPRDREPELVALLSTLGRLWLAGTAVDWDAFYAAERRRRLPLPTYPFERRRFWLEPAAGGGKGLARSTAPAGRQPDLADWFYVPSWQRTAPLSPLPLPASGPRQSWLVLASDTALSNGLVQRLTALSQDVICVRRGEAWQRLEDGGFMLQPGSREDYEKLLAALRREGRTPQRIVHLWTLSEAGLGSGDEAFNAHLELGFYSLLALAQALGKEASVDSLRIDVVSSNMQDVIGGELLWPEKAALLGPCRVIPKEYAGFRCRSIDVDLTNQDAPREPLLDQLLSELLGTPSDSIVAYRGKHRWVPRFEPLRLEEVVETSEEAPSRERLRLRSGGCYLITGGLGGVGLALAEHLARSVRARLILVGRSSLPPRDEWRARLESQSTEDETSHKLRRILEIEALGAEVLALSADVGDPTQMASALAAAGERFGLIQGVVHAAGISPGGVIQLKTPEAAAETLRSKVAGTRILASLLAEAPLDFFLFCSSRGAFLAPPGSVDYAAANAFLDAFAHGSAPEPWGLTTSINWCAWQEVGMLAAVADEAAESEEKKAASPATVGGETIDYPLFDRRWSEPRRDTYLGAFSVSKRWVLDEHRIAGVPVIPGTTYLEMARAAMEMQGIDAPLEIHDVYFLAPVGVREDEEREVRLMVEQVEDGFTFRVASREVAAHGNGDGRGGGNGDGPVWQQNVLGRMRPLAVAPRQKHDIDEIIARCRRGELIASIEDEQQEDLGPRWHAVQQVYLGEGEVLAALELPEEFAGDLERLKLHPSLVDRSASLGEQFLVEGKQGAYLPMSYQSLKTTAPLPRKIYSWARLREADFASSRRETFSFDVVIMDEQGVVLVDIENFSKKLIHDPGEQLREAGTVTAGGESSRDTEPPSPGMGDGFARAFARGISPAEGVEVFRRVLARGALPQIVVSPTDLEEVVREAEAVTPFGLEEAAGFETTAPSERHNRPDLDTAYQAPVSTTEARLAELWQEMFGIEQIGVRDNFFELGGDSVLGLQIVAKARQTGLQITPNQLFEHQTIAELAEVIGLEAEVEEERSLASLSEDELQKLADLVAKAEGRAVPAADALASIEDAYRLSPVQQGMLFHSLYAPHSGDYVLQLFWRVHGTFDAAAFEQAWRQTLASNPILRTAFFWEGLQEPLQVVRRQVELPIGRLDWRALSAHEHREHLADWIEADRRRGFDLRHAPLMRLNRMDLDGGVIQFVWSHHHLLLDGWSVPLVFQELSHRYQALRRGQVAELEPRRPYRDYIAWLEHIDRSEDEAFWRRTLSGFTSPTYFALRRPDRRHEQSGEPGYRSLLSTLPDEMTASLQQLVRRHKLTLNTVFQGAWALVLRSYSGEEDVVFGGAVSGRPPALKGVESMVGPFINTLPVRTRVPSREGLVPWLQALQMAQLEVRRYEHVPLLDIQGWSEIPQGQALFDSLMVFENLPRNDDLSAGEEDLDIRGLQRSEGRTGYPFALAVFPGDQLTLYLTGLRDHFSSSALGRLDRELRAILHAFADRPEQRLGAISLLTASARQQLLLEWNDTPGSGALRGHSLPELFEARVARSPETVALVFAKRALTYRELNRRANRLASYLRRHGVGPEVFVALCVERSVEMVVGLLAVLKAGGAYVPLDPLHPPHRLAALLEAIHPRWILTQEKLRERIPPSAAGIYCLESEQEVLAREDDADPGGSVAPENLAYVLYTSGSTGLPKGVCCTHQGVVSYLSHFVRRWALTGADAALQVTSLPFDPSVRDLFGPLSVGAKVVLLEEGAAKEPAALVATIRRQRVTCLLSIVPTLLSEVLAVASDARKARSSVRLIMANGEVLLAASRTKAEKAFGAGVRLVNQYGPTECTMTAACHELGISGTEVGSALLGRSITTDQCYVLDRQLAPVPVGVAAELHIASGRLARGYLDRPSSTAASFIPNPFAHEPGERLYKTGDRICVLSSGELDFVSRLDHQIKLRGYRVEPGEIEAALAAHSEVREAVVVLRDDLPGGRGLVAYLTPRGALVPTPAALRTYLTARLPSYMVPGLYVLLEALPQTPNGKIDRGALRRRALPRRDAEAQESTPRTPLEELLAGIFSAVLGVEGVGVEESFFALGGHSLLAMQVVSRVREVLGYELALRSVFETPTVAGLAAAIERQGRAQASPEAIPLERVGRREVGKALGLPAGCWPTSFAQQRLWFLDQLVPGSPAYNIFTAVRLDGALSLGVLASCLFEIVRRHETLRTTFITWQGEPVQVIGEAPESFPLPRIDLQSLPSGQREAQVRTLARWEARQAFDLSRGPLLRVRVLVLEEAQHVVLLTMHHIISDGWSMGVLVRELGLLYEAFSRGHASPLPALAIQYADFAYWQRQWLSEEVMSAELSYWKGRLGQPPPPVLELPTDRPRPAVQTFAGASWPLTLPESLSSALEGLSRRQGTTLHMTLLAAYQLLLSRYSGQQDVAVGMPIAGRRHLLLEGLIGFFVNTLVVRTNLSRTETFAALLAQVRELTLSAYSHQDLPFEKLVAELEPDRDLGHTPLFQTMFEVRDLAARHGVQDSQQLEELALERLTVERRTVKFDLAVLLERGARQVTGHFSYSRELFDASTLCRLTRHFATLLERIVAAPGRRLGDLALLGDGQKHQLLVEWNAPRSMVQAAPTHSLAALFEAQAALQPEAVAVVLGTHALTYGALDQRANVLAWQLRGEGVGPEAVVGLCTERSLEMVVGLLAVLKAGGAYLPLDPAQPGLRLASLLAATRSRWVLTQDRLLPRLPVGEREVILLDWHGGEQQAPEPVLALPCVTEPASLAYVAYTSGSTGAPKGICGTHGGAVHYLGDCGQRWKLSAADTALQLASLTFDASLRDLLGPLFFGARVVLVGEEAAKEPAALVATLGKQRVTCLPSVVPTLLAELLTAAEGASAGALRLILVSGEVLPAASGERARWVFGDGVRVVNQYGPSECTMTSSVHELRGEAGPVPLGRPLGHARFYVLDRRLMPAPLGVPGELHIAGAGVVRGYLDRPAATAALFVPDPFNAEAGARMYKTGDRVRHQGDGELAFLGRLDLQIKLRGHRLEPGEIEAALAAHPGVRQAAVVVREDLPGDRGLVAYVTPGHGGAPAPDALRVHLAERLPSYMLPGLFVVLEALPLTPNGKIDRAALRRQALPGRDAEALESTPRTPLEELLAGIFSAVLGVEEVGTEESFFALGGHSLLAMQVVSRVREVVGCELALRSVFETPTVAGLAAAIEREGRAEPSPEAIPLERVARREVGETQGLPTGHWPTSFAQQRLWFLDQLVPDSPAYNIFTAVRLDGALSLGVLASCLATIVQRHETLRTTFTTWQGEPVQVIGEAAVTFPLPRVDLRALPTGQREAQVRSLARWEARQVFDLSRGPLLRVRVLVVAETQHVVLLTMHHIISDGWSMGVLVRELGTLYEAYSRGLASPLPALQIQYGDFAYWQRQWLSGEVLAAELAYWKEQLGQPPPPVLELPTDRPRPAVQTFAGASWPLTLPAPLSSALDELSRRQGTTLHMTLLAAYQLLLSRYGGQQDVAVGMPIAGRRHLLLEGLIGFFVNTLVVRTELSQAESFTALLARVREQMLSAYSHQDLPFEKLVAELEPERDLGHTPLFQTMFEVRNRRSSSRQLEGERLKIERLAVERRTVKFDLAVLLERDARRIAGQLSYSRDLFDPSTLCRLTRHFAVLLTRVVAEPGQRLGDLALLSDGELHQLLVEWNAPLCAAQPMLAPSSLSALFAAQAALCPEAVAVVIGARALTYGALDCRADRLARHLRGRGVGPEAVVGLCVERSLEMVVGLLAVLKAGGAYLPLDPAQPRQRLASHLAATRSRWVLTQERLRPRLPEDGHEVIVLDGDLAAAGPVVDHLCGVSDSASLAYVAYTSGSTGQPKGIGGTHGAAVRYLTYLGRRWELSAADTALQLAALTFDASLRDLLGPLCFGGRVVLVDEEAAKDPTALVTTLSRERVTCLPSVVPTVLAELLTAAGEGARTDALRLILVSGEVLPAASAERARHVFGEGVRVVNQYGPSECTLTSSAHVWRAEAGPVPLGRPIDHARFYVLDRQLMSAPLGVAGELYIAGAGLVRGYLGRPAATAAVFVPDPFSDEAGSRMYKSGDRVRYLGDGELAFLGRLDHQIKLRGLRVEPGEIEAALADHPAIRVAAVVVRDRDGVAASASAPHQQLVAYFVSHRDPAVGSAALRTFLAERLPAFMIPHTFAPLGALPRTPTGKVDRKALLAMPERSEMDREHFAAPRTPAERTLAAIWSEVLGVAAVGRYDNFFALGGDSLLSIRVLVSARQRGLQINVRQIFEHQRLDALAAVAKPSTTAVAGPDTATGELPLTPIQYGLLERSFSNPHHWNITRLYEVHGELRKDVLEAALAQLARHHDALRLRFFQQAGAWRQVSVSGSENVLLSSIDLSAIGEAQQGALVEAAAARLQKSLDLAHGPLFRLALFKLGINRADRLLFVGHHLVLDNISMQILTEDLQTLYLQLERQQPVALPSQSTSFRSWAERLKRFAESEALEEELGYWASLPWARTGRLPADDPDGENTVGSSRSVRLALEPEESALILHHLPAFFDASVKEILLTAIVQALAQWTGRSAQLIVLARHARSPIFEDLDVARTVGWFVVNYPVVLTLNGASSPDAWLRSIASQLSRVPRSGIGYGALRYLSRDPEIVERMRSFPEAEIAFNYRGQRNVSPHQQNALLRAAREDPGPFSHPTHRRPSVLHIAGQAIDGRLQLDWVFSQNRHRRATIERVVEACRAALQSFVSHYRKVQSL